jgi:hypothetical protein
LPKYSVKFFVNLVLIESIWNDPETKQRFYVN